jgi:hypothetical protein
LLGAQQSADAPDTGQIAGVLFSGKHRGVPGNFFVNLSALVLEHPPVVLGLAAIGVAPMCGQANDVASGRTHRAHGSPSRATSPLERGELP